jgi:hypothetical protein
MGLLAAGGEEQWSVVSGSWLGATGEAAGGFFVQHFSIFPRFLDSDVPYRIGCWRGFFLMLGKLGVKGRRFCSTEVKISTFSFG